MSKAKEFWIFPEAQKIFASSIKDSIHVIEFKAYDTLLAKSLKLRADLDLCIEALKIYAKDSILDVNGDYELARETLAKLQGEKK